MRRARAGQEKIARGEVREGWILGPGFALPRSAFLVLAPSSGLLFCLPGLRLVLASLPRGASQLSFIHGTHAPARLATLQASRWRRARTGRATNRHLPGTLPALLLVNAPGRRRSPPPPPNRRPGAFLFCPRRSRRQQSSCESVLAGDRRLLAVRFREAACGRPDRLAAHGGAGLRGSWPWSARRRACTGGGGSARRCGHGGSQREPARRRSVAARRAWRGEDRRGYRRP